jgi:hypothetical protein
MQLMDHATNTLKGRTLTYMRPTIDIAPPSISAHESLELVSRNAILQHLDLPPPSIYRLTCDELGVALY